MHQNLAHAVKYDFQSLEEAFPGPADGCDPETAPMPHLVLLQIRRAKNMTSGGIALTKETQEAEAGNTQVAKVLVIGSNCFKNPDTLTPWKEGPWFAVGDYLRIPKFNGFRFSVKWEVPKKWATIVPQPADRKRRREEEDSEPVRLIVPQGPDIEDIGFVMFEPIQLTGKVLGNPLDIRSYI